VGLFVFKCESGNASDVITEGTLIVPVPAQFKIISPSEIPRTLEASGALISNEGEFIIFDNEGYNTQIIPVGNEGLKRNDPLFFYTDSIDPIFPVIRIYSGLNLLSTLIPSFPLFSDNGFSCEFTDHFINDLKMTVQLSVIPPSFFPFFYVKCLYFRVPTS
jgi:hypothetical protein